MRKLLIPLALLAAACRHREAATEVTTEPPPVDCVGSTVMPGNVNLHVGDTVRFRTTGGGGCGMPTAGWWWSISNPTIATVDSAAGLLRALSPGTAAVVSHWLADPKVTGAAAVRVEP